MRVLDRYVARAFLRLFTLILGAFVCLYVIVDFFERVRMFITNDATLAQMAAYFLFSTPHIVAQTTPLAVLLAALICFGSMSRYQELLAMKANGISLYRASLPVFAIATAIAAGLFLLNEYVTPASNRKADYVKYVQVQKRKSLAAFKHDQLWYRGRNGIYNFRLFRPETNTLLGVAISYLDDRMRLTARLDAERAEWRNGHWVCHHVLITHFPQDGFPRLQRLPSFVMDIPERPEDFLVAQKDAEQMGYRELRRYVRKMRADGYDVTPYLTDMHAKVAFPFVVLILAALGVSFSTLRAERSGGAMQSIGAGIALGFSYWIVHALALSFGRAGIIPPLVAAWFANTALGLAALILLRRIRT